MNQKATKTSPETGAKTFEDANKAAFFFGLSEGSTLYSPLFGYMKVRETNASGIMMTIPNLREDEPSDFLFRYNGRAASFDKGECLLFLSHLYRRWNVLNFQPGDIVAMDIKYKDGNTLTYVVIFGEVEVTDYPRIRTYACLCKNSDLLAPYAQLDFCGTSGEEESIDLRYATPTEEKLLTNAVERIGRRWDKEKQRLVSLDSEATTAEQPREDFNALQKEYSLLSEHCKKLEQERDEAQKRAEQEVGRILDVLYHSIERLGRNNSRTDD